MRLPFFHEVDARRLRRVVHELIDAADGWPAFLKEWHKARVRIVSESPQSIETILCNVNRPRLHQQECCCEQVQQQLRDSGRSASLPMIDGHIFCIGREFPCGGDVMKICGSNAGYERIHVAAATPYRVRRYKGEELERQIVRKEPVTRGKTGGAADIVSLWKRIYRAKGWSKYAQFNAKGGFNVPYALFKAKNVTDPTVRQEKWAKARPIAPGTKHPMRRLLHLVGRAWYWLAKRDECGDSFVCENSQDVPRFLEQASRMISQQGPVAYTIKDIEGCFPSMPKDAIRMAMRDHVARIMRSSGQKGVSVPRYSDNSPCDWRRRKDDRRYIWIPFDVMIDVM